MGQINRMNIALETHSQLTRNYGPPLTRKRKREIRFNGIRRLIESKENGHLFSMRDLIEAAGYRVQSTSGSDPGYNNGWAFVKGLLDRGVLVRVEDGRPTFGRYSKHQYEVTNNSIHGRPTRNTVKKTTVELLTQRAKEPEIKVEQIEKTSEITVENTPQHGGAREGAGRKAGGTNKDKIIKGGDKCYSFKISITKRQQEEHGKLSVSELEMNDINLVQLKSMVNQLVSNYEV